MRTIGAVLLLVLIILVLLTMGGAALLLLAYGLGLLVSRFTQMEPFQATVLALMAILAAGILAERIWTAITKTPDSFGAKLYDEDEEVDEEDDQDEEIFVNPGIPRWRQPLKPIDFSDVDPDDRCPCGSGRKYKNCHGAKQAKPTRGIS